MTSYAFICVHMCVYLYLYMYIYVYIYICRSSFIVLTVMCLKCCCSLLVMAVSFRTYSSRFIVFYFKVLFNCFAAIFFWNASFIYNIFTSYTPFVCIAKRTNQKTTTTITTCAQSVCRGRQMTLRISCGQLKCFTVLCERWCTL